MDILESRLSVVRLIYFCNLAVCAGFVWFLSAAELGLAFLTFFLMNVVGVTMTFHRFLSHRSFLFRWEWCEYLCASLGMLSGTGSAIGWVGIHRDHHAHTDEDKDPHCGAFGFWRLQGIFYNDKSPFLKGERAAVCACRDLLGEPFYRETHRWYFAGLGGYLAFLSLFGLDAVVIFFCLPSALTLFSENLVNWAAHQPSIGYRRYETIENSRNVWWLNLLSFGDGWHNNHHHNPDCYTTSRDWWEIDVTAWLIRIVGRMEFRYAY